MIRVECSPRALTLRVEGHAYRGKPVSDGFSATPKGFTLSIFRESQTFLLNPRCV